MMEEVDHRWFLTDRDEEIAKWIDENLEDGSYYTIGRTSGNQRVMIVVFGSDVDETLYALRWGEPSA